LGKIITHAGVPYAMSLFHRKLAQEHPHSQAQKKAWSGLSVLPVDYGYWSLVDYRYWSLVDYGYWSLVGGMLWLTWKKLVGS
jgi:hypothetical protein